jgi:hypothetical protein
LSNPRSSFENGNFPARPSVDRVHALLAACSAEIMTLDEFEKKLEQLSNKEVVELIVLSRRLRTRTCRF